MATNVSGVANTTFQKLIDALIACVTLPDGSNPAAAPNAMKDRVRTVVGAAETGEVEVIFRTNPGGNSAYVKIRPIGARAQAIEGAIDSSILATKLV